MRRREAAPHALRYLLFSLVAAFFLLAGFATAFAVNGNTSLAALRMSGPDSSIVFVLLAIGLLIKCGAIGVHVWLPDAYANADDDVSAILSAIISKVPIFGLLVVTYLAIRSETSLNLAHVLGWIGMLTTLAGAMMAVRQDDIKRMLAYSSMSQLGYIVTAIALMSHLGWVTALYLVVNHMMVKGILFLAVAAVILRTDTRTFGRFGRPRQAHAVHVCGCGRGHHCHVGVAAAHGFWRQMAFAQRDDGEGLVRPGHHGRVGDLCRACSTWRASSGAFSSGRQGRRTMTSWRRRWHCWFRNIC